MVGKCGAVDIAHLKRIQRLPSGGSCGERGSYIVFKSCVHVARVIHVRWIPDSRVLARDCAAVIGRGKIADGGVLVEHHRRQSVAGAQRADAVAAVVETQIVPNQCLLCVGRYLHRIPTTLDSAERVQNDALTVGGRRTGTGGRIPVVDSKVSSNY